MAKSDEAGPGVEELKAQLAEALEAMGALTARVEATEEKLIEAQDAAEAAKGEADALKNEMDAVRNAAAKVRSEAEGKIGSAYPAPPKKKYEMTKAGSHVATGRGYVKGEVIEEGQPIPADVPVSAEWMAKAEETADA